MCMQKNSTDLWVCHKYVSMCKWGYVYYNVHVRMCEINSISISFSLISAPRGALQLTWKGRGVPERLRPRTGPPHWGERRVQRARLAPTGSANTAHLKLQFYFHIISISKSLLAALAFGSDKRRVGEGVEGWREGKKEVKSRRQSKAMSVHFICWCYHGIMSTAEI